VSPMTTVRLPRDGTAHEDADGFRRRLLDGLAASIAEKGYQNTTIADIVRGARTSRRTFYESFSSKEACYIALLTAANTAMVHQISASVDQTAPWAIQVRQAIEAWIACAESEPAIMLSWIRDPDALRHRLVARRGHRAGVTAARAHAPRRTARTDGEHRRGRRTDQRRHRGRGPGIDRPTRPAHLIRCPSGSLGPALLPGPAAFQFDFEGETEEGPYKDDHGEDSHAGEGR
jgi:AcrR family transcriptional regulator